MKSMPVCSNMFANMVLNCSLKLSQCQYQFLMYLLCIIYNTLWVLLPHLIKSYVSSAHQPWPVCPTTLCAWPDWARRFLGKSCIRLISNPWKWSSYSRSPLWPRGRRCMNGTHSTKFTTPWPRSLGLWDCSGTETTLWWCFVFCLTVTYSHWDNSSNKNKIADLILHKIQTMGVPHYICAASTNYAFFLL